MKELKGKFMSAAINFSFEFFPPKTPESMNGLKKTAVNLAALEPQFFSVTFGAGGSTREGTIEVASLLQQHTRIPVAPHLTCVGLTRRELTPILERYALLGVRRIVALRGDLPAGCDRNIQSELSFASDLVAFIRSKTHERFYISVAAYPECHPQTNAREDILNLKRKYEAGANNAITQYFF